MQIEIWSDIACPWCYIGKRRFEKALSQFEHHDEVEVIWRSYELDPDAPASYGTSIAELLSRKYGVTVDRAREMNAHLAKVAALDDLNFRSDLMKPGNTFDAHRLTHLAATYGKRDAMTERLMKAYLGEGVQMSDREELIRLAAEVGLDSAKTREALVSDAFAHFVRSDQERGYELGIEGVPFFVIADRYGISGAQPVAVFLEALRTAWNDDAPATTASARCVDESCTAEHP